ncbi:hypothetical protein CYMTET_36664 [Cymbomonas tetramitiformis]|uniref:Uncharacterized protein n=1 Tax=Cymbomonas tetramitiformis TaxID=36881 RepID=A0AAE0CFJ8_9CHLO|nr:hypothetical protein CYMTET_36664 [Cymbomonas tetramitiformis]
MGDRLIAVKVIERCACALALMAPPETAFSVCDAEMSQADASYDLVESSLAAHDLALAVTAGEATGSAPYREIRQALLQLATLVQAVPPKPAIGGVGSEPEGCREQRLAVGPLAQVPPDGDVGGGHVAVLEQVEPERDGGVLSSSGHTGGSDRDSGDELCSADSEHRDGDHGFEKKEAERALEEARADAVGDVLQLLVDDTVLLSEQEAEQPWAEASEVIPGTGSTAPMDDADVAVEEALEALLQEVELLESGRAGEAEGWGPGAALEEHSLWLCGTEAAAGRHLLLLEQRLQALVAAYGMQSGLRKRPARGDDGVIGDRELRRRLVLLRDTAARTDAAERAAYARVEAELLQLLAMQKLEDARIRCATLQQKVAAVRQNRHRQIEKEMKAQNSVWVCMPPAPLSIGMPTGWCMHNPPCARKHARPGSCEGPDKEACTARIF